jgi:hypothetical protein
MANHGITTFEVPASYKLHAYERESAITLLRDNVLVIPIPKISGRRSKEYGDDTISIYAEFADGSGITHTLRVSELVRALTRGEGDIDYWIERVADNTLRAMAKERFVSIVREAVHGFLREQKR